MITHEILVERARALAPVIAERARETEELRQPHDDTIRDLIDAEFMQILVPKRWGGHEMGLDTHREVVEIISAACPSTGWALAFYIGHNLLALRFSEQAQKEFFNERPFILAPATMSPTSRAERTADGWKLNGRASWSTGIMHADWTITAGVTPDGETYVFAIPIEDLRIDDVWHMAGMSGTGSNDTLIEDVFVPEYRSLPFGHMVTGEAAGTSKLENPLYRAPFLPFVFAETTPIFSGALRGAAAAFKDITLRRVTTHAGTAMKEDKSAHITLGEAQLNAFIAERLVADQQRQFEDRLGAPFSIEDHVYAKGQAAFIVDHCRRAVNDMAHKGGTSNFSLDAPLQRFFRDINMLATHAFWDWTVSREQVGRDALDLAPNHPLV